MRKTIKTMITTLLFIGSSSLVVAQNSSPEFGINAPNVNESGHVVANILQNEEKTDFIKISNLDSERRITIKLSVDPTSEDMKTNISKEWIEFASEEMILSPEESKEIEYTVKIPAKADPGTYSGYITATMISYSDSLIKTNDSNTAEVKVLFAVAQRLTVNVLASEKADTKNFFTENWAILLGGLVVLIIIVLLVTRSQSAPKGKK